MYMYIKWDNLLCPYRLFSLPSVMCNRYRGKSGRSVTNTSLISISVDIREIMIYWLSPHCAVRTEGLSTGLTKEKRLPAFWRADIGNGSWREELNFIRNVDLRTFVDTALAVNYSSYFIICYMLTRLGILQGKK